MNISGIGCWLAVSVLVCVLAVTYTDEHQIKCFESVLHYHTNPAISGKSALAYTYRDEHFHELEFHLHCSEGHIEVKTVDLMMPRTVADYCIESKTTSYRECKFKSPCRCCEMPAYLCKIKANQKYDSCNNQRECSLKVETESLRNCRGKKFDCDKLKCNSR